MTQENKHEGSFQIGGASAGSLAPPLAGVPEDASDEPSQRVAGARQAPEAGGPEKELPTSPGLVAAKVPLHPALVTAVAGSLGALLASATQYEGFEFSEQELETLHALWQNTGLLVTPIMQAAIGTTAMVGEKAVRYGMHRRRQQEEAKKETAGTSTATAPPVPNAASDPRIPVGIEN